MKDTATVIETPLIGSGSQEEVDNRVNALLTMGTSRGYLTYEELNENLPDEVVSPDKLDSLLMMIDEMGIKLIDENDVGDFQAKGQKPKPAASTSSVTIVSLTTTTPTGKRAPAPTGEEPAPEELS